MGQTLERELYQILIVDNSTNRPAAEAFYAEADLPPFARVVWSEPPGVSRARNAAAAICGTPYIAYLDDDAVPEPGWLAGILGGFRHHPRVAAVGGPISPMWAKARPEWLPEKCLGLLSVLELGDEDRELPQRLYLYGANMAYAVEPLRTNGGFPEQVGRVGAGSLLSGEETHLQDVLRNKGYRVQYVSSARVFHLVHEDRLRRNWMRSRMSWQSVSEQLETPPKFLREWTREELKQLAATNPDIGAAARLFFAPAGGAAFASQLEAIRHFTTMLLGAHNINDAGLEAEFANLGSLLPASAPIGVGSETRSGEYFSVSGSFAPSAAGASGARCLFVEGIPGHRYLYDLFGDLPGAQLVTYPATHAWDSHPSAAASFTKDLAFVYRSLGRSTKAVFFLTYDQALYGPNRDDYLRFIAECPIPVHGILHRMPRSTEDIQTVRRLGQLTRSVCFLSEVMAERGRSVVGLRNAQYLPHHPMSYAYASAILGRDVLRTKMGVLPHQTVFSVIGEARHGKGIDLLISSLTHVPIAARNQMHFLFCGKARHFSGDEIRAKLTMACVSGTVDLRMHPDETQYAVLTDREYAQYVAASDVGVLLYENGQRLCMSGVLGDYVWAGRPVLATRNSYVGAEVQRNDLGLVVDAEEPRAVAAALVEALRLAQRGEPSAHGFKKYREKIDPKNVLRRIELIVDPEIHAKAIASAAGVA
jgi:hypothetical protein